MVSQSSVIVPLYVYPSTPETWSPLHDAIAANPQLNFLVVVNPNSGPGEPPWWPDANYIREVPKLNEKANVCTLGYVLTGYATRDINDTLRDVSAYSAWAEDQHNPGLFVRGIFFDETPNDYSIAAAEYLDAVNKKVKSDPGIIGERLVVHNPGTMPDEALAQVQPDVTIVFEESLARYRSCSTQERQALENYDRDRCSIMLHSVPVVEVKDVVREIQHHAKYLFVTDLYTDCYSRFGSIWETFIRTMQE